MSSLNSAADFPCLGGLKIQAYQFHFRAVCCFYEVAVEQAISSQIFWRFLSSIAMIASNFSGPEHNYDHCCDFNLSYNW